MKLTEKKLLELARELVEEQKKDNDLTKDGCCIDFSYCQNALRKLQATVMGDDRYLWRNWPELFK